MMHQAQPAIPLVCQLVQLGIDGADGGELGSDLFGDADRWAKALALRLVPTDGGRHGVAGFHIPAYHLARRGCTDVVSREKDLFAQASTGLSAG